MYNFANFPKEFAQSQRFSVGTPRTISVSANGRRIVFLRSKSAQQPALCLWKIDLDSATEEELLFDPTANTPGTATNSQPDQAELKRRERARESGSGIVSYTADSNINKVAFVTAGQLIVVDFASKAAAPLPTQGPVFDPRFDKAGNAIAYVSPKGLHLLDLEDNRETLLAGSDDPAISWGKAEFIAAEEMSRTRGFWWSPNGQQLLATRVDEAAVTLLNIADPANPKHAPQQIRYPFAGEQNANVNLSLINRHNPSHLKRINWSADGKYEYLADVYWAEGNPPLVVRQTRDQKEVSIAKIDLDSLRVEEIHSIKNSTWVENHPGAPQYWQNSLLTIEDQADHRCLMLDGQQIVTPEIQVKAIVGQVGQRLAITFWTKPNEIHVGLIDASGTLEQITEIGGVHQAIAGGSTLVVTRQTPENTAVITNIYDASSPDANSNNLRPHLAIADYAATPTLEANPTFLSLGERQLSCALFLPANHNGTDKLPVLLDPYGGPHGQRVLAAGKPHLASRWLAEQGYAVLVCDGRGTPGYNPQWERAVWGDLANPVIEDQLHALDAAAVKYPFLDLKKVGVRGWSFGGYLAALAVLRHPDRFHAAIAGAPVTDWRLYDTHYTERYLGHPDEFPDNYKQTSLLENPILERPLMLIHGLADDNVVAAHTLQLSNLLLSQGAQHEVLPLSGVTHMTPQASIAENLLKVQACFLQRHLKT